ncbi:MAG: FimB/Mfa2 family fimbrial subunit [Prevotella sp.]|nr:FimB/Mfa2 family fimbrial subunit [Prevotella sp.]
MEKSYSYKRLMKQFTMNGLSFVRVLRIATAGFLLISCGVDGGEFCPGVRLEYRYNRENASLKNVLAQYVQTIDEYVFDSDSVLVSVNRLPGTSYAGPFVSELDLPPGRYIAVAWGNRDGRSFTERTPVPGVTTLRDLEFLFDSSYDPGSGLRNDSERLYYGYRTFSVTDRGVSRIPVDMTHAHCELHVVVAWENAGEMPARSSEFGMTVSQVPSSCGSIPVYSDRNGPVQPYVPAIEDYPVCDSRVLHCIPDVYAGDRLVTHYTSMRMDVAELVRGQVISYRYCGGSHPLLGIYIDGSLLAGKLIDLNTFFSAMQTDPGRSLRQEYRILLMVNGGKITVSLMLDPSGWEEGGQLGGRR